MRLFHKHEWQEIKREHYDWVSKGIHGENFTNIYYQCALCRKHKSEHIGGMITRQDELNAQDTAKEK